MKSNFLLILLFTWLGTFSLNAQFTEDFEGSLSNWGFFVEDMDDDGFLQTSDQQHGGSTSYFHGENFNTMGESSSWMVAPAYTCGANDALEFWYFQENTDQYNYSGVFISVGSDDPEMNSGDFVEIQEFNASAPGGLSSEIWTKFEYDLSSYDGQTIYVAFKFRGDIDSHKFYVDDMVLEDVSSACSLDIPYTADFSNDACWVANDVNGDNVTWEYRTNICGADGFAAPSSSVVMDDWLFSPSFNLTSGTEYEVSFMSGNNATNSTEKMDVFLMDSPDPATANKVQLYRDDVINDGECYSSDIQVVAPSGWTEYYIGFHGRSDADQGDLFVSDFDIIEAPTLVSQTVEDNNANNCDLTIVNGVSGDNWHQIRNSSNVIAAINANGQSLGTVYVEMRDAGTNVDEYDDNGDLKKTLPKFYNFDSDNTFANPVTIRLFFTNGELTDFNDNTSGSGATSLQKDELYVTHYDGLYENCSILDDNGNGTFTLSDVSDITTGTTANGFYMEFETSSFSEFFVHEDALAPLPIELSSFTGKSEKEQNHLAWITAQERNAQYFQVERKGASEAIFSAIGRVEAIGQGNYEFTDNQPSAMAYYRLKMVDLDGSFEYSRVISLIQKNKQLELMSIYPVPTRSIVNVQYRSKDNSPLELKLRDMMGNVLYIHHLESKGEHVYPLDLSTFPKGIYFVELSNGMELLMNRVVKE